MGINFNVDIDKMEIKNYKVKIQQFEINSKTLGKTVAYTTWQNNNNKTKYDFSLSSHIFNATNS